MACVDPAAVRDAISTAQTQRETARAELAATPDATELTEAEVYAMIDALGDVGSVIKHARSESLIKLYQALGLRVGYCHSESGGFATVSLAVANECVRGGLGHRNASR